MNALATDLQATASYERAERRIKNWAYESKKISTKHEEFATLVSASRDLGSRDSSTSKAVESVRPFKQEPRKKPISMKERERLRKMREDDERRQKAARRAELRRLIGDGPLRRCRYCNKLCRAPKCPRCKKDLELVTARGKQSRGGAKPELQPPDMQFSRDAALVDSIVSGVIPPWAANAIKRSFLWKESTEDSAEDLHMTASQFTLRVRGAVQYVIGALAEYE